MTYIISFPTLAIVIGAFGLVLALARTSTSASLTPFRFLATVYVDVFRGVPLLLVILLVGFGGGRSVSFTLSTWDSPLPSPPPPGFSISWTYPFAMRKRLFST